MSLSREDAANALIDLYGYFRLYYTHSPKISEAISMATASLRNEPAQPQIHIIAPDENTAKWIYDHWCEFKCSKCGTYSISTPIRGEENYCYNCGCKMIKEENYNDEE